MRPCCSGDSLNRSLLVAACSAMLAVSCCDPGFVQPPQSDAPVTTETKPKHSKQIESVASHTGLLPSTKAVQTDASCVTTNPPQLTNRDGVANDSHRDEEYAASLAGGNHVLSEVDSIPNDEDNKPEVSPAAPISLPPRSEAKTVNFETRLCLVCMMEQPLRVRHCRQCNKCVALYDHHCPWLGICIAERNKFRFFWYLVLEAVLLWFTVVQVRILYRELAAWSRGRISLHGYITMEACSDYQ